MFSITGTKQKEDSTYSQGSVSAAMDVLKNVTWWEPKGGIPYSEELGLTVEDLLGMEELQLKVSLANIIMLLRHYDTVLGVLHDKEKNLKDNVSRDIAGVHKKISALKYLKDLCRILLDIYP